MQQFAAPGHADAEERERGADDKVEADRSRVRDDECRAATRLSMVASRPGPRPPIAGGISTGGRK